MQREEGRIKNWFRDRGYGFIRADDGRNIFVHVSQTGFLIPNDGSRCSFDIGENPRTGKPEAKNVAILDGEAV
jgi:cold shock CspA family protein